MYPKKLSIFERSLFWFVFLSFIFLVIWLGSVVVQFCSSVGLYLLLGRLLFPKIEVIYSAFKQSMINNKLKQYSFRGQKFNVPNVSTTSQSELISAIQKANANEISFSIKGSGHSIGKQFLNSKYIIKNVAIPGNNGALWRGDNIVIQGRATIKELTDFAKLKNRKIRCIQDHGDFTVGGTLSVGGIGWDSLKYGFQANYIKSLKVITPNGSLLECSEAKNNNVFKYVLAGMGQLGAIEEAEYETVKLKPCWKKLVFKLPSLESMFMLMKTIQKEQSIIDLDFFHTVHALQTKKSLFSFCGKFFDSLEEAQHWQPPYQLPLEYLVHVLVGEGKVDYSHDSMYAPFNAWEDYMFPSIEIAMEFSKQCFGDKFFKDSTPFSAPKNISFARETVLSFYLIKCPKYDIPLLPGFPEQLIATVGVYYCLDSHKQLIDALARTMEIGDSAVSHGGKPYNYGAYELSTTNASLLYSSSLTEFNGLKRKLDPKQLCNKNEAHALTSTIK